MLRTREIYRLVDATRGTVVAGRVRKACGWWERLVGLIGRRSLSPDQGLWIDPCNGLHTFGMRIPIDVLVLDEHGRVLRILTALSPWRVSLPLRGGRSVVEMEAGALAHTGLAPGDPVRFESLEDDLPR